MTLFMGMQVAPRIASGDIAVEGDAALYDAFAGMIEPLTPNFLVVTP